MKRWLVYLLFVAVVFAGYGMLIQDVWAGSVADKKPRTLWERARSANFAGWVVAPKPKKEIPTRRSHVRVVHSDEELVIVDPFAD